ncbi:hypothetical protein POTOM_015976 [Populus tomentosa]|uniref:ATP synthase subunit e, mitochondrial n=1 Tax=Populus tomentosa TaxID=118781 RepID=A0A8X8A834_POPTO|nr:hypothetical protein POTOM_015976 [Populus tomentosa]
MAPPPGPYSGTSTLALVARVSAFSLGLVYGSVKLKYLQDKGDGYMGDCWTGKDRDSKRYWPGKREFDSSVSEQLSGELFLHQARLRSTLITVRFLAGGGLVLGGAKFSAHSR